MQDLPAYKIFLFGLVFFGLVGLILPARWTNWFFLHLLEITRKPIPGTHGWIGAPLRFIDALREILHKSVDHFVLLRDILHRLHLCVLNPELLLAQMYKMGIGSFQLLAVTSFFTGMVAAVQAKYQFRDFVPDKFVGTAAMKMILIELGPVLTGLVLAGRVGSAITAEIASMKEKEELDAMKILNLDILRYLAAPRMLTALIMVPTLTIFSIWISLFGAYFISVVNLNLSSHTFLTGIRYFYSDLDVIGSLLKSITFGGLVCLIGFYRGIHAAPGSEGVGKATMKVVVQSCVGILCLDFIITLLVF